MKWIIFCSINFNLWEKLDVFGSKGPNVFFCIYRESSDCVTSVNLWTDLIFVMQFLKNYDKRNFETSESSNIKKYNNNSDIHYQTYKKYLNDKNKVIEVKKCKRLY